jgi:hypothetical protein
MSLHAESATRPAMTAVPARRLAWLRRGSLAVLTLIVAEYAIGMYVNLYITVPSADHGRGLGEAISNGPATLSLHAVIGLALALGAIGLLVLAIRARRAGVITLAAAGLVFVAGAAAAGTGFTRSGDAGASMGMATFTGAALLCYAVLLYLAAGRAE